jgi:hypothetical protein
VGLAPDHDPSPLTRLACDVALNHMVLPVLDVGSTSLSFYMLLLCGGFYSFMARAVSRPHY